MLGYSCSAGWNLLFLLDVSSAERCCIYCPNYDSRLASHAVEFVKRTAAVTIAIRRCCVSDPESHYNSLLLLENTLAVYEPGNRFYLFLCCEDRIAIFFVVLSEQRLTYMKLHLGPPPPCPYLPTLVLILRTLAYRIEPRTNNEGCFLTEFLERHVRFKLQ